MQQVHKSGPLKQQNKTHKHGRHRTNREIEKANKGKVDAKSVSRRKNRDLSRDQRRNQVLQLRKTKREEAVALKRGIGGETTPPILVLVYSYSNLDTKPLLELLKESDPEAVVHTGLDGSIHLVIPRFKKRYQFITVLENDLFALLDAVKVVDMLLLLHPLNLEATVLEEDPMINAVFSHFLPTTIHALVGLESVPIKKRAETKKAVGKAIEGRFPDEKLHSVDKPQEALQLLNHVGNCKRRRITYKKNRSQVMAEKFEYVEARDDANYGTLIVTGYVRNKPLNANNLVHIPGYRDFQMEMIELENDPHPLSQPKYRKSKEGETMEAENLPESKIIQRSDPLIQEPLECENLIDDMEGEQNFPTAEEIIESQKATKLTKRVVKGTSEYQAAWIMDEMNGEMEEESEGDDDDSEGDDSDEDYEDAVDMEAKEEDASEGDDKSIAGDEEDYETITVGGDDDGTKYDEKMDEDEEKRALAKYKEMREQQMFPDEVDTPIDTPARVRFARYRGLKSFSYSTWDAKENLPSDYSRIFQFENFNRTRRRVLKAKKNQAASDMELDEDQVGARPGLYVRVHVKGVPKELAEHFRVNTRSPLVLYGLLQHEQRMSVLNLVLKRHALFSEPVKAKERLIFHIGCRRFYANPIFSNHTNGNKFKYERFLRSDEATVASIYAPITYAPASVIVFKEYADGSQHLVATGSLMSVNPDRLVIKRAVLSGHPLKISNRNAVVRYMFHAKDDINWFKPIELRTNSGRKGHIKEPLGTHGHMKCVFDKPIRSYDTVLMHLYKRVFPKWTYEPRVEAPKREFEEEMVDL